MMIFSSLGKHWNEVNVADIAQQQNHSPQFMLELSPLAWQVENLTYQPT